MFQNMGRNQKILIWGLIAVAAAFAVVNISISLLYRGTYQNGAYGPYWMMGYGFYGTGIFMPVMGAVVAIFIILVLYLASGAATSHGGNGNSSHPRSTPEEIARLKYASGDISEEEYLNVMENLRR